MNVLIVCTGNICRSPFAERLLAARLAESGVPATVASCGTDAVAGCKPVERTLQVARQQYHLDLADHRARQITAEMVDASDLLLAMTGEHVRLVVRRYPGAAAKTITMRAAAWRSGVLRRVALGGEQWIAQLVGGSGIGSPSDDVVDPYGGPLRLFRAVADDISVLVESLVSAWPRS
jgi:protein-tyrosine phosphatase